MNPKSDEEHAEETRLLMQNLLSHSHVLRRCSLDLLSMPLFRKNMESNALQACLEAENIPISVQGVRERVLATSRVGRGASTDGDEAKRIRIFWLLGQLKVGLRPLWAAAIDALALISQASGENVWNMVFEQLSNIESTAKVFVRPLWDSDEEHLGDDINETEKMWRDPSAHKLRIAVRRWISYKICVNQIIEVRCTHPMTLI